MKFYQRLLAVVGLAVVHFAPASAATLSINGSGTLNGASSVDVNGTLYDAEFMTGTCAALFGGCDEDADFAFQDQASATAAATALFDQVFTQGSTFDLQPNLTQGCANVGSMDECLIFIPYGFQSVATNQFFYTSTENWGGGHDFRDRVDPSVRLTNRGIDFSIRGEITFARFTEAAVVPLPAAGWLLIAGLGGLAAMRRLRA